MDTIVVYEPGSLNIWFDKYWQRHFLHQAMLIWILFKHKHCIEQNEIKCFVFVRICTKLWKTEIVRKDLINKVIIEIITKQTDAN